MRSSTRNGVAVLTLLMSLSGVAFANDYAPTPHSAPRTPVAKQALTLQQAVVPASRVLEGQALAIDSEKIRLGGVELRLFGVVPPQLSASYGPQARALLDRLTQNTTVHCQIRDRANDSRLLATCANAANADLALELLKHGLAVSARGSLLQTDLAATYAAAEQAAQAQKLGLWSGVASVPTLVAKADPAPAAQNITPVTTATVEKPAEKPAVPAALKVEAVPASSLVPATPTANANDKKPDSAAIAATTASIIAASPEALAEANIAEVQPPAPFSSFIEKYQLLLTGLLMLTTALSVCAAVLFQKRLEKREERSALAAALRGELMAARAVCLARLQQLTGKEEGTGAWPRIRVLVFQSHVGRIGWLGAELARQVSSIYGLASDYAAFYQSSSAESTPDAPSKKQALQKLIGHIDTVLPRLAAIESEQPWTQMMRAFSLVKKLPSGPGGKIRDTFTTPVPVPVTLSITAAAPSDYAANTNSAETSEPGAKAEAEPETSAVPEEKPVISEAKQAAPAEKKAKPSSAKQEKKQENKTSEKKAAPPVAKAEEVAVESEEIPVAPVNTTTEASSAEEKAAEAASATSAAAMLAWARLKRIKDFVQDHLVPHPIDPMDAGEHDEYLALLNAEAEAFASYDFSAIETTAAATTQRRKKGN